MKPTGISCCPDMVTLMVRYSRSRVQVCVKHSCVMIEQVNLGIYIIVEYAGPSLGLQGYTCSLPHLPILPILVIRGQQKRLYLQGGQVILSSWLLNYHHRSCSCGTSVKSQAERVFHQLVTVTNTWVI